MCQFDCHCEENMLSPQSRTPRQWSWLQCPPQSPQVLSYSPCSSHPEHFYIGLRRHLLQFLPSSWLHTELSKIACHHDHEIITWNGCKSGGRLGWWTRKSWKDSSTFTLLSKISGSPPTILYIFWNAFEIRRHEVKSLNTRFKHLLSTS